MKPKFAVYLDEISFDPIEALELLKAYPITNIVLRNCWTHNICKLADSQHKIIKHNLYKKYNVVLLASDLGNVPAHELFRITDESIVQLFVLTQYYNTKYVRINLGLASKHPTATQAVKDWVARIAAESIKTGIIPLFEPSHLSQCFNPVDICEIITKPWRILFDPAQLITTTRLDPFVKYWVLLRSLTDIIDIHDYKISHGGKLAGAGDAKLEMIINDAMNSNYAGWFVLEPGIGRRTGDIVSKNALFSSAYDACKNLFGDE